MRTIYALADPRTDAFRYVGKADNLKRRIQNHLCPASLKKVRHVAQWLSGLRSSGMKPIVHVLEELDEDQDWQESERRWILHFRAMGFDLVNLTPGGEGGATRGRIGSKWTAEQRERYRKTRKGMKVASPSSELIKKRGEAVKAHWAKMRELGIRKRGQVHTSASRENLRKKHLGKKLTLEHRRKMSIAKLGKKQSPESIEKRIAPLRGRTRIVSEEQKAKLRAAWVRRKLRKEAVDVST